MVQMFVRTVVRMRVIASYSLLFISILLNIFCPYFSILLDFIFPCATQTLFSFHLPPTHVATRRRMLVFAMVLVVSVLSWFAI